MPPHKSWSLLSFGLLMVVFGTLILMLFIFQWEQSFRQKKSNHVVFPTPKPLPYSTEEKEAKVTTLDPKLIFNPTSHHESFDQSGSKESTKEFNLLQTALKASQEQQEQLAKSLDFKTTELQKFEEEIQQHQHKVQQVSQDFADYKLFSEEQLKQKQLQLTSLQQIIEDQRTEMEKRQDQIHQLDTKVHDLSYEIKTLLYLHEEESPPLKSPSTMKEEIPRAVPHETVGILSTSFSMHETPIHHETHSLQNPVRTATDAANLLKKCINNAQKLTGANYSNKESSRYREFPSSYYAIDQRRLFDNLRSETGALIIVYSQKEPKLLFVNNESKTLLGWSPEKFISEFSSIMQEGINDWKKAISLLTTAPDSQARLLAKTKNGQEVLLNCHLGVIPTGLFRHFVIGVLYPA